MTLTVRAATPGDARELCALLNEIISIGGSTAYEAPLAESEFLQHFIARPEVVSCVVAEDARATLLMGFQYIGRNANLPED